MYDPRWETWVIQRCRKCGQFNHGVCCSELTETTSVVLRDGLSLTTHGKQALGLIPIVIPTPKTVEQVRLTLQESDWWTEFRGVTEFEGDGSLGWIIQNVLPYGVTELTGMPKGGKSFVALSWVKAITTGQPWLGRVGFEVPEVMPCLWLAAESGDSSLKMRCKKFGITEDKSLFIARTLTQGMLELNDLKIEKLVKAMHPCVVLETLVRFGDGEDENNAKEAAIISKLIFKLLSWGAKGVFALHHSRKDLKLNNYSLENASRGSGEYLAMTDAIWTIIRDEKLYHTGEGVNEIVIAGWGRDFNPYPMRLSLTRKAPADLPPTVVTFAPGLISVIDDTKDLGWVDKPTQATAVAVSDEELQDIVTADRSISVRALADKTGLEASWVSRKLKKLGWTKGRGNADAGELWTHKDE